MGPTDDPSLALVELDTGVPGATYGEFDTARLGGRARPFRAARMIIAPGGSTPLDVHDVRECWYVAAGGGRLELDGRPRRLAVGELLYFDSGQAHRVVNDGSVELVVLSVWWPVVGEATGSCARQATEDVHA